MSANEAAFPIAGTEDRNGNVTYPEFGLTKREYFAAKAMQGHLANSSYPLSVPGDTYAVWAVAMADMLIAELNKVTP